MMNSKLQMWERFQQYYREFPEIGLAMDLSRMNFPPEYLESIRPKVEAAVQEMKALESGTIANADEKRMVGHYWLRNPALAPQPEMREQIDNAFHAIKRFAEEVHTGKVRAAAGPFTNLLIIGIGGSALGPQFVSQALRQPGKDKMAIYFLDNTDPDGIDRVFADIGAGLAKTLCIVISKSGGTKETRNGMLEAQAVFRRAGLAFGNQAVAITSAGSELDRLAASGRWLRVFPMWDWVGGRTSELSAVGLLPAALQGFNIDELLAGARACDELTRKSGILENPAAALAAMWFYAGEGKGIKNMVVLPYKDRLELFSKYLQQLVMESLGKALDRDGKTVNQGITVLGNKGATDQHSYIQQLRDGLNDFFVTFIQVERDRQPVSITVDPNVTSGDFLNGFFLGTRQALHENNRESLTLKLKEVSPYTVGLLIALFERAVGLYASMINVNAYHQPGVEAGKKAATAILALQGKVYDALKMREGREMSVVDLARATASMDDIETIFWICEHLSGNPDRHVAKEPGAIPLQNKYGYQA